MSDAPPAAERPSDDDAPIRILPPRGRRRLRRGVLGVLASLGLLRALAPGILDVAAEARIERATGGACSIDDVDVDLLGATITFEGITIAAEDPQSSATALRIAEVDAFWGWHELLFGDGGFAVDVRGIEVDVDLDTPWPGALAAGDGAPRKDGERVRSLNLRGGRIVALVDGAPVLTLGDLTGELCATAFGAGTDDSQTTRLHLRGEGSRGGVVELAAAFAPLAPSQAFSLDLSAERIDLRQLNPVLRRVLELDVEEGSLSATVKLAQAKGRRRGRIEHQFHDLRLYSPDEPEVAHPMAEALFEAMLNSSDQPILIDEAVDPDAEPDLDLRAGLDEAAYRGALDRITGIILRGYERRLNTLDGYRASIGGLEVDFPSNHLIFTDIRIEKIDGELEAPFLELRRLEVDVEQSVLTDAVQTRKAVTLVEPRLTFVAGPDERRSQLRFDPAWTEKISALPFPTDALKVEGGTVALRETASTDAPAELGLVDLEVEATSLAPGGDPAKVTLAAQLVGGGQLSADLRLAPQAEPVEGALSLHLGATPLAALNPITRHAAGVDASSGTIALDVDATIGGGEARATILPVLSDVELLGENEHHDRPLRELLLGARLRRLDGEALHLQAPAMTMEELRAALPSALLEAAMNRS
ncbi:MAG: DUF748 domain-containing protein [Myxococcales bacterium]|nr:DUF748 domain-containing protein [Myxococcales bacterium]